MKNMLRKQLKKCWKKTWHNTRPPKRLHWFRIVLEQLTTIQYTHTNQGSTLTRKYIRVVLSLPHRSGKGLYRFYVSINGSSHSSINGSVEGNILAGLHVLFAIKYGSVLQFFPETNSGIAHLHLRVFMPSLSSQHTRLKQWFGWQHANLLDVRVSIHVSMFVQMTLDGSV